MIGFGQLIVAMAMGAIALGLFYGTLQRLSIGVTALALTVPIQTRFALHLGGHELTWTKLMFGTVFAAWIIRILLGASHPRVDAIAIAFACNLLVLIVSIANAQEIGSWAGETYRWAVAFIVYLMAIEALTDLMSVTRYLAGLSVAVIGCAIYAGWQLWTGAGPATFTVDGLTRVYGTFGEPNPFASYLELSTLLLVCVVLGSLVRRKPWFDESWQSMLAVAGVALAVIVGAATLLATQSRGGYIGFAAGMFVAIWLVGGRIRILGAVGSGICLVLVLLSPFGPRVLDRFRAESFATGPTQVTVENWASQERAAHWSAAVAMAKTHPIIGVGAGNYNANYRESTTVWRFRIPRGHAHDAYLQALAQAGLLGLLSYLGLLFVVAREIASKLKRAAPGLPRALVIGVASVSVAVSVHNLVDYLHVLSLGIQLSVVWAILKAVPVIEDHFVSDQSTGHVL